MALPVGLAPANAMQSGAIDQSAAGRIAGRVSVIGAVEKPKPLPVFKSRSFCGASVPNETLLVTADGRLRNAAVILRSPAAVAAAQPKTVVLDNQHCAFTPHIQIAPLGSELLLKNSDPILHTVHARLDQETLFNVGLPRWRQVVKRLDRAGVIRIDCDVLHTWMSAAIIVTDSPYYFVSNEKGEFFFDGLPAGVYDIEIWHERLGRKSQRIAVRDHATTDVDVVFALEKKP
ncbi:MAG TPA: carboxypeptidase regulatory-like domain-containing protein [Roseiflexaceae bacterium]|nr:carboxypeptidase regulatory-like domain-containing protein [Roseiflexaceae bacterium]